MNPKACSYRWSNSSNMDPSEIWTVIKTYNKGFFYLWQFPIQFNTADKTLSLVSRSSTFFTIWKLGFGFCTFVTTLSSLFILLWLNFVSPSPLHSTEVVILFFTVILSKFLLSAYLAIVYWMENITQTCNELSKGLQILDIQQ